MDMAKIFRKWPGGCYFENNVLKIIYVIFPALIKTVTLKTTTRL